MSLFFLFFFNSNYLHFYFIIYLLFPVIYLGIIKKIKRIFENENIMIIKFS